MQIIARDFPQKWEFMKIYAVSDTHIGDILFNHVEFYRFTKMIEADPRAYIILNGDIINNNLAHSVGSSYEDTISPQDQKLEAVRLFLPLRERILCAVGGNHEQRTKKDSGQDITEEIAFRLGVPYSEDEAYLKIKVGYPIKHGKKGMNPKQIVYGIYVTHGSGGGKKPGSQLNNLEDLSKNIFADVYIVGHGHRRTGHKAIFRLPDLHHNKVTEVAQLYCASAGWLMYGGYPVRKLLRQQIRGANPVILNGREKDATVEI